MRRKFLRKLIKPALIMLFVALAVYGAFSVWGSPKFRTLRASIFPFAQPEQPESFIASFLHDSDGDNLSDAKELIYGTKNGLTDSDNDGYKDGDEVRNGYDPTISGKARMNENIKLSSNLTVQYFTWMTGKTGDNDPRLDEKQIEKFLEETNQTIFVLPEIPDREINIASSGGGEAVMAYINAFATIELPAETASYLDIAENVIQEQRKDTVEKIIAGISDTEQKIRNLQTPTETIQLQKGYLGLFKGLRELFADLYDIDRDPVKLMRDVRWGGDLIDQGMSLERIRIALAAKYTQTPAQTEQTTQPATENGQ